MLTLTCRVPDYSGLIAESQAAGKASLALGMAIGSSLLAGRLSNLVNGQLGIGPERHMQM